MAVVTSLTETKIRELLAGWEGVELSQEEINILIQQLFNSQDTVLTQISELNNVTLPQLEATLAENDIALQNLNEVDLVNLEASLAQNNAAIEDLVTVTIPLMQQDVQGTVETVQESPKQYRTPEQPTNPDEDNRDLVVGDSWYDPNDNYRMYMWNGAEWALFTTDVADFSLTVKKFISSSHMIY